ncbi:SpoIID/LytB domain-containing protein [Paludicola sp. MB14-C6]|uniref:SpoIID/LytB domain-containing protein n=1 Tax=Paludihabitans sp. MB14-C6 TaxID=3070656 RepID=UPI0027DB7233|nr:SpoIID/LytB domain-containing protein [Paludicola sp. MB14-C6]WMJ22129.1 SpoIID/LytB domain-containing protein [Paludicola sp. MB14-C6]
MKGILWNLIALLCAVAIFSGSIVYAASNIEKITANSSNTIGEDDFYQSDVGIGDLLSSENSNQSSSNNSSQLSSVESSAPSSSIPSSSKVSSKQQSSKQQSSIPHSSKPKPSETSSSKPPIASSEISNENSGNGEIDEDLLHIVSGAVQREIVGTNTAPKSRYYEAYKAQAVACRTYMEYHKRANGTYPSMPYAAPYAKTIELVKLVWNEKIYYNGSVINAVYHAASGGSTQSAKYVWGGTLPYLQARPSKYDDYISSSTISQSEAANILASNGISVSGDASNWFDLKNAALTDGGFIDRISICGTSVRGRTLRESIFGNSKLKSCKITDISVSDDNITFTTKGYGHGVGMSQLGALGYSANEGWNYQQILQHYYIGVTIR